MYAKETNSEQFNSKHTPENDTDNEFTFHLFNQQKQPQVAVSIANIPTQVIIDSGSTVNIIDEGTFRAIKRDNPSIALKQSNTKIYPYVAAKTLTVLGQFSAQTVHNSTSTFTTFQVIKGYRKCILSCSTSTTQGLLKTFVNTVQAQFSNPQVQQTLDRHKSLFQGMGKLKG